MAHYLVGLKQAAKLASAGLVGQGEQEVEMYTSRCAFDLFSSAMFGRMMATADLSHKPDPRFIEFGLQIIKVRQLSIIITVLGS